MKILILDEREEDEVKHAVGKYREGQQSILQAAKEVDIDEMAYKWITQINEKPLCVNTLITQNGKTFSQFIQEEMKDESQ